MALQNEVIIASELGAEFDVTGTVASELNHVKLKIDGQTVSLNGSNELQSPITTLSYDNVSTNLSYVDEAGNTTVISLAGLTSDIFVNGGSFDANTSVLTLTDNDGTTPDVTINLAALLGVSTDANNALTNGTDGKPFLDVADLNTSTVTDNGDGTYTHSDGDGTSVVIDTRDGVSTDTDQILTVGTDQLPFLDCDTISATCTVELLSLFGTPVGRVFPL